VSLPTLVTRRLTLRAVRPTDAPDYLRFRSDPEAARLIPRTPDATLADAEAAVARVIEQTNAGTAMGWTLELTATREVLGLAGLVRIDRKNSLSHVAWEIDRKHWRQGYTKEAMLAVIDHAFTHEHFHRLEAHIDPRNVASLALAGSLGFVREAILKENAAFDGGFCDTVICARLNARS
jgi:[ribosomal protein S5]-alanine N-acetyltransferase